MCLEDSHKITRQKQRWNCSSTSVLQHCQGMKAVMPADKGEILTISVPEESFKCESGTQERYIDNDYSPGLWLTQLLYTPFYTYELVYNSETTLPKEIQLFTGEYVLLFFPK